MVYCGVSQCVYLIFRPIFSVLPQYVSLLSLDMLKVIVL